MNSVPDNETKIIADSVTKTISFVSLCIMFAFFLHSCKINSEILEDCNAACETGMGYMKSVTSYKCICADQESNKTSPWVLPN